MTSIIREYLKFRKAGFLKSSITIFVLLLLPSIICMYFNILRGDELPTVLYVLVTAGDIILAVFVPIFVVGYYNFNKYKFYTTLPIKSDNIFKLIYFETYTIIIMAFFITGVVNLINFDIYSFFVQIFKMMLVLCISNVIIPRIATEEFIINSEKQETNLVVITMVITFIVVMLMSFLILAGPETLSSFLDSFIVKMLIILLTITFMGIAAITLQKSYLNTMNKVRLMDYSIGNNNI